MANPPDIWESNKKRNNTSRSVWKPAWHGPYSEQDELWDILPGVCLQVYCGPNESPGQLHKCAGHWTAAEAMDCDVFEMQQEASVNSHLLPVSFTFSLNQRCPSNSLYPSTHQLGHLYLCIWEMLLKKITCINYTFFSSFINWNQTFKLGVESTEHDPTIYATNHVFPTKGPGPGP